MQRCTSCGLEIPSDARFCAHCGQLVAAPLDSMLPTSISELPTGSLSSTDVPTTPGELSHALPDLPVPGAMAAGSQAPAANVPVVHGMPQASAVPGVENTPSIAHMAQPAAPSGEAASQGAAASGHSMSQGAVASSHALSQGGAGLGHAMSQGVATSGQALSQGVATSGSSLSQSAMGSGQVLSQGTMGSAPALPAGSQPALPSRPGARPPEPHRHHDHREHHEPHRHHDHREHHELQRGARVTKVAGGSSVKTIIIVVTTVVVVVAGGIAAAAHFLSGHQPFISITSNYRVGNTLAGAPGTILHISGQQFSSNSAITFLLDGHVAPGNAGTRSDANGNFSANVTITAAWSVGTHTLTARDASNDSTKNGVSVTIVQPGQANTPGPNGAPPDDSSFRLKVTIQAADPNVGEPFDSNPVLIITGHPDPEGGTVCSPDDSGQSFTQNGTGYNNGIPYTEVETATCSGTYKASQISYIETDTSASGSFQSNGITTNCVLNNPAVILRLTGAYAGNNTFSGTINYPYVLFTTCDQQGSSFWQEALQGTWTGTIVTQ